MEPARRRESERAFEALYESLVKTKNKVLITESKTKSELCTSGGLIRNCLTLRTTCASTTLQSLSFSGQKSESVVESNTYHSTTFPRLEHFSNPGSKIGTRYEAQGMCTKSVISKPKLRIQHAVPTDVPNDSATDGSDDGLILTLDGYSKVKGKTSLRIQHSHETDGLDDSSTTSSLQIQHSIASEGACDYSLTRTTDWCFKDIGKANPPTQPAFPTDCADYASAQVSAQHCSWNTGPSEVYEVETLPSYLSDSDESVVSGESPRKAALCVTCQELLCKMLENPYASRREPGIVDPYHWCCSYWMMNLRVPWKSKSRRKTRDLRTIVKDLAVQAQFHIAKYATSQGKCCRPHGFLERNIKSGKKARQNTSRTQSKEGEKYRGRRSTKQLKKKMEKNTNRRGPIDKRPYVFKVHTNSPVGDTSRESCREGPESIAELAKRKKLSRDEGMDHRLPVPNTSLVADSISVSVHNTINDSSSVQKNMLSRLKPRNLMGDSPTDTTDSFEMERNAEESMFSITVEESEEEGSDLHDNGDSSPFSWVGGGSFRELLAKMNSKTSSSVVREY